MPVPNELGASRALLASENLLREIATHADVMPAAVAKGLRALAGFSHAELQATMAQCAPAHQRAPLALPDGRLAHPAGENVIAFPSPRNRG